MNYAEQLASLTLIHPALGAAVAQLRNLEAILKWAPSDGIAFSGIDLLQQDEYSYDLFLPLGPRASRPLFTTEVTDAGETPAVPGEDRWLCFSKTNTVTTCSCPWDCGCLARSSQLK